MRVPLNPREKPPLEPTIHVGKKGVTDAQIKETIKQLEARRIVKVKVLRSALTGDTVENIAQRLSLETNSRIVQIVGHTFTLYKPKRRLQKRM
ncbi:MAG: YhbY family RNA-binding protein [Candidatus Bathyarchaeia archaeon]|nr:YhbY family RNA-binding protein [Candidatus Bathyarchaeota archaeon]